MSDTLLRVEGLKTRFFTEEGQVNAVDGIDLEIDTGETFGIVGESGSGKSVTARSIMDLIKAPGRITDGEIWYRDADLAEAIADQTPEAVDRDWVELLSISSTARQSLRGTNFSMIFQDPLSSFNPSITVGEQIAEAVEVQQRASANPRSTRARSVDYTLGSMALGMVTSSRTFVSPESRAEAIELLELVGIPDPAQRADEYPHEYSGGMLQRAMIAQALAGEPDVLIADEPTTALDVTIQAQILDLLSELKRETGMTILLITHNLGVVARMCDRVGVMYAGEIVERGTLADVFDRAVHPYTEGLLGSIPDMEGARTRLEPIPGNVLSLLDHEMPDRCYFAERCPKAMEICLEKPPEFEATGSEDHATNCYLADMTWEEGTPLPESHFDRTDEAPGGKPTAATDRTAVETDSRRGDADGTAVPESGGETDE